MLDLFTSNLRASEFSVRRGHREAMACGQGLRPVVGPGAGGSSCRFYGDACGPAGRRRGAKDRLAARRGLTRPPQSARAESERKRRGERSVHRTTATWTSAPGHGVAAPARPGGARPQGARSPEGAGPQLPCGRQVSLPMPGVPGGTRSSPRAARALRRVPAGRASPPAAGAARARGGRGLRGVGGDCARRCPLPSLSARVLQRAVRASHCRPVC